MAASDCIAKRGILYKLDFASGKSYIGVTTRKLEKRIRCHQYDASKGSVLLAHRAWRKYGEPTVVILAVVENHMLMDAEMRAIVAFGTMKPNGYNLTPGGNAAPTKVRDIAKRSGLSRRGRKFTPEHCQRISKGMLGVQNWLGKNHSADTKLKMRSTARNIHKQYEFHGVTLCLDDWADRIGIKRQAISNRMRRGWTLEKALTTPVGVTYGRHMLGKKRPTRSAEWCARMAEAKRAKGRRYFFDGKERCLAELCEISGFNKVTIGRRIKKGWSVEKAVTRKLRKKTNADSLVCS